MEYNVNSKGEKNNTSEYKVKHPKGKIVLLDGTELICYEKPFIAADVISIMEERRLRKLFTANAFYLLAHRDRILSDSRMFLCPVAVKSELSNSGNSGFHNPTLGVYLEWWKECPEAMITDQDGKRSLVYHLAGSGISGENSCSSVDECGELRIISVNSFLNNYCRPFIGINTRYSAAKHRYQSYSLDEVLEILHAEDNGNTSLSHVITAQLMQGSIIKLNRKVEELHRFNKDIHNRYEDLFYKIYGEDICRVYAKYKDIEQRINSEVVHDEQLQSMRKTNQGQEVIPLKGNKPQRHDTVLCLDEMNLELLDAELDCLDELHKITGEKFISIDEIEHYVTKYNKNNNG